MYFESRTRAIVKTLSYRFYATITTMALVYLFSGKLVLAAAVGGTDAVAKLVLFYIHERIWDKIKKGKYSADPIVIWLTGLPCSGKTTIANALADELRKAHYKVERLDGDAVRSILPSTGFSAADRNDHIRRMGFLASLLERNGVTVVASFVSPYRESRDFVRTRCKNFVEVYISTPLQECEKRDVKGLYAKARQGLIRGFTGVDDPYEPPLHAELVIDTSGQAVAESVNKIMRYVRQQATRKQLRQIITRTDSSVDRLTSSSIIQSG